jgi:hypothetical protein
MLVLDARGRRWRPIRHNPDDPDAQLELEAISAAFNQTTRNPTSISCSPTWART